MIFDSIILLALFAVLGISADVAVRNIKYIASVLRMRLFAFGILLGLITSLPELSVGINATVEEAGSLSAGNLLGGILVIFGLVLGASLLLNRQTVTDGKLATLVPEILVILSPIPLGLDGRYGLWDGIIMSCLYVILVFYLYRINYHVDISYPGVINRKKITKAIILSLFGVIAVLLSSHWIVTITLDLLQYIGMSKLVIGLLVFSIGTNLPEATIAITSWRKKVSELSLSHLLSSAFTNVLIFGILSVVSPIVFKVNTIFILLAVFYTLIMVAFLFFYHSGKKMDRREGAILLLIYIVYLGINIYLQI